MIESTTVKSTNNAKKDDIYYHIKNGEISFFYRDFLLFKHNKNNPAISVIIYKGEAEKEIPLVNYNINKINVNDYVLDFYYQLYKVNIYLKLTNNILDIQIKNQYNYSAVKLSLKNSVGKIKGFGYFKEDIYNSKEICSDGWTEAGKREYSDDKILAFIKEKKYFLCAEGNFEWKVKFGNFIDMYFKKTHNVNLRVIFGKDIEEIKSHFPSHPREIFDRKGLILKTTSKETKNAENNNIFNREKVNAIILCDEHIDFWDLRKYRENYKKNDIKVLRKVQPKISIIDDYFNEFAEDDFVKNSNGKILMEKGKEDFLYFDLSNSDTCRKVKNYIRRILGTNIDGLYSVEKENSLFDIKEYAEISRGNCVMWQAIIYEASLEYLTPKTIIFDTLTSSTYGYGYYAIDSRKLFSLRYKKYLENLKNSGVFNIVIDFSLLEGAIFKHFKNKLKQKFDIIYK